MSKSKASKEDKARQDEHRQTTLARLKGGGRNYLSANSGDFLVSLRFNNNLPAVPSGPFFKKIGLSHNAEDFAKYSLSSLEKNYIWQRHLPHSMNVTLNLEDHESMCEPQDAVNNYPREVELYLEGSVDRSKQTKKQQHISAHWWLRETKYSENGMAYKSTICKPDIAVQLPEGHEQSYYDQSFIESSFTNIEKLDNADEVEWSVPILPGGHDHDNLAFARFDEDPEEFLTRGKDEKIPEVVGKKRAASSVLTNIRDIKKGSGQLFGVSMVVPSKNDENQSNERKFQWVRDFAMDLNTSLLDTYLFVIEDNIVSYNNVTVYLDLHKLGVDEIQPHDCDVIRV